MTETEELRRVPDVVYCCETRAQEYSESFLRKVWHIAVNSRPEVAFPASMLKNAKLLRVWFAYWGWSLESRARREEGRERPVLRRSSEALLYSEYIDLKEGVQISPKHCLQCLEAALLVAQREGIEAINGSKVITAIKNATYFAVSWGLIEQPQGHRIMERLDVMAHEAFVAPNGNIFYEEPIFVPSGQEHRLLGNFLASEQDAAVWRFGKQRMERTRKMLLVRRIFTREVDGRWTPAGKTTFQIMHLAGVSPNHLGGSVSSADERRL